jgi:hypothetical protein
MRGGRGAGAARLFPLIPHWCAAEMLDETEPKEEDKWGDLGLTELSEM